MKIVYLIIKLDLIESFFKTISLDYLSSPCLMCCKIIAIINIQTKQDYDKLYQMITDIILNDGEKINANLDFNSRLNFIKSITNYYDFIIINYKIYAIAKESITSYILTTPLFIKDRYLRVNVHLISNIFREIESETCMLFVIVNIYKDAIDHAILIKKIIINTYFLIAIKLLV